MLVPNTQLLNCTSQTPDCNYQPKTMSGNNERKLLEISTVSAVSKVSDALVALPLCFGASWRPVRHHPHSSIVLWPSVPISQLAIHAGTHVLVYLYYLGHAELSTRVRNPGLEIFVLKARPGGYIEKIFKFNIPRHIIYHLKGLDEPFSKKKKIFDPRDPWRPSWIQNGRQKGLNMPCLPHLLCENQLKCTRFELFICKSTIFRVQLKRDFFTF